MRLKNLILQDIKFQFRYGIYFIYAILIMVYACILFALPQATQHKATLIMVLTDPAAMGLFFMGAIFLLEKSQRVLNSIAVSPVRVSEYVMAKAISISVISMIVSGILATLGGGKNLFGILIGTTFGSILFSMLGLWIAIRTATLNTFLVVTASVELVFFIPSIVYLFGSCSDWMLLHPACAIMQLYLDLSHHFLRCLFVLMFWCILILWFTSRALKKMWTHFGGVKL